MIREAIEKRKTELVMPWKARLMFSILQLSPQLGDWLLAKVRAEVMTRIFSMSS